MRKANLLLSAGVAVAGVLFWNAADAQYFGSASAPVGGRRPAATQAARAAAQNAPTAMENQPLADSSENRYSAVEPAPKEPATETVSEPVTSPFDYAYGRPTKNKSAAEPAKQPYRRYSTVGGVTVETDEEHEEDELIMLYMKNFSVYRSPSGQTRCSARFAVLTTLPVKLSNISYRLKWPNMETVLSFSDVEPGVENHFDYGLLGDGCFSMDRQPNIVVNRCRAKGMTQRECASKIRWIKEI